MRAESLASKMIHGKSDSFWADIWRYKEDNFKLPQTFDSTSSVKKVAMLWEQKIFWIFNSDDDCED